MLFNKLRLLLGSLFETKIMKKQNTEFELLQVVALLTELPEANLHKGQVGTIVEVHTPTAFEVEFVSKQGKTIAIETLRAEQLFLLHHEPLNSSIAA